ncbi:PREDICTED: phosphatidylinositol/phosphatidylcholine transfer protein SFH2-like isoform X1 [Brassica oleracea var. oleracea]|nr:PREDICTED: phosphatidylinositol/phosphatidylcholine transfer protein SFH2-like isoform X1 [Brassica oleracea var. oleracea]
MSEHERVMSISLSLLISLVFLLISRNLIMADTIVAHTDQQNNLELLYRDVNPLLERKWYVYGVVMALLMWIVGVMRLTKNMPRRLAKANVYPDGVRVMPTQEYMAMAKKMADLEEKYDSVDAQVVVSREKEKVLDAALGCVDQLQLQLSETKKALDEIMTRQHQMMAFVDKKKKKKRKFLLKGCFGGVSSASSL